MRKRAVRSITSKVAIGITIMVAFGCTSGRINLVDNGMVTVERIYSRSVYVSKTYVYQDGDDLVISGRLKRRYRAGVAKRGHVDIAVLKPDGTVLKQISKRYPRLSRKKRTSSFTIRLPIILPKGAIVRVAHHRASRKPDKIFDCGMNLAVPRLNAES